MYLSLLPTNECIHPLTSTPSHTVAAAVPPPVPFLPPHDVENVRDAQRNASMGSIETGKPKRYVYPTPDFQLRQQLKQVCPYCMSTPPLHYIREPMFRTRQWGRFE